MQDSLCYNGFQPNPIFPPHPIWIPLHSNTYKFTSAQILRHCRSFHCFTVRTLLPSLYYFLNILVLRHDQEARTPHVSQCSVSLICILSIDDRLVCLWHLNVGCHLLKMEGDKDAYYVVRKGDVFGFYRSLKELEAQAGCLVSAHSFVFKLNICFKVNFFFKF